MQPDKDDQDLKRYCQAIAGTLWSMIQISRVLISRTDIHLSCSLPNQEVQDSLSECDRLLKCLLEKVRSDCKIANDLQRSVGPRFKGVAGNIGYLFDGKRFVNGHRAVMAIASAIEGQLPAMPDGVVVQPLLYEKVAEILRGQLPLLEDLVPQIELEVQEIDWGSEASQGQVSNLSKEAREEVEQIARKCIKLQDCTPQIDTMDCRNWLTYEKTAQILKDKTGTGSRPAVSRLVKKKRLHPVYNGKRVAGILRASLEIHLTEMGEDLGDSA